MSNELGWKFGVEYGWSGSGARANFLQHHEEDAKPLHLVGVDDTFSVATINGKFAVDIRLKDGNTYSVMMGPQSRLSFTEVGASAEKVGHGHQIEALKWFLRCTESLNPDPKLSEIVDAYNEAQSRAIALREVIEEAKRELAEMNML